MTVKAQFPDEQVADGSFDRQEDAFRDWVTADGSSGYPAAAGRYHLYVSLACPWACRTIIVRKLKGLEDTIGMTIVDPIRDERGWRFADAQPDPLHGWRFLSEAYTATDAAYSARITVPVLWDKRRGRIVSNSDDDIMRMFESEFDAFATNPKLDLYPRELRAQIDDLNGLLYETFNDGVIVPASPPRKPPTSEPPIASSKPSISWKNVSQPSAIFSERNRSKPIGAFS